MAMPNTRHQLATCQACTYASFTKCQETQHTVGTAMVSSGCHSACVARGTGGLPTPCQGSQQHWHQGLVTVWACNASCTYGWAGGVLPGGTGLTRQLVEGLALGLPDADEAILQCVGADGALEGCAAVCVLDVEHSFVGCSAGGAASKRQSASAGQHKVP